MKPAEAPLEIPLPDSGVECHSGYAYAGKPRAIHWQGKRLEVAEILAEWRTPQAKHFRVRTGGGQAFELSCAETSGDWKIQEL